MEEPKFKGIIQMAYIVSDLEKEMEHWVKDLGVGPWFTSEHFAGQDKIYRGKPTDVDLKIGMSYSGQMNIELIQQINDAPSPFRETAEKRGYGFHHYCIHSDTFDEDFKRYSAQGYDLVFTVNMRGARIAYFDNPELPGMIELVSFPATVQEMFLTWFRAAQNWDGSNPYRKR